MTAVSLAAASAAGIFLTASTPAFAQARTTTALKTGYAPVNGLNLYYEIHGTGEPLILLHGGVGATEMFGEIQVAAIKAPTMLVFGDADAVLSRRSSTLPCRQPGKERSCDS